MYVVKHNLKSLVSVTAPVARPWSPFDMYSVYKQIKRKILNKSEKTKDNRQ